MDIVTPKRRSEIMSRIRGKNTSPELAVRRYLHKAGLRFRLYRTDLPGRPDIVFPGRRLCVFVHGCFWHGCARCIDGTRTVRSNTEYWGKKVEINRNRDHRNQSRLEADGWRVLTLWECQTRNEAALKALAKTIRSSPARA